MVYKLVKKFFTIKEACIIFLNSNGSIHSFNAKTVSNRSIKLDQVKGKYFNCLYSDSLKQKDFFEDLLQVAKKKGNVSRTLSLEVDDDKWVKIKISISPVKNGKEIIGYRLTDKIV
jgi:hypothetical protein